MKGQFVPMKGYDVGVCVNSYCKDVLELLLGKSTRLLIMRGGGLHSIHTNKNPFAL